MTARRTVGWILCALLVGAVACNGGGEGTDDAGGIDAGGQDAAPDTGEGLAVLSLQPSSGPASGGTDVAISGRGFEDGATVKIGGKEAKNVEVQSAFQIGATTPAADSKGVVDVVVELPGGESSTLPEGFEYEGKAPPDAKIEWCKLQHPETISIDVGSSAGPVYGRVYVKGCTDGKKECEKVTGQVGWVSSGGSAGSFNWKDASYNSKHTSDNNDEHQASFQPKSAGTYDYAFRFSLDGNDWTYCDLDGTVADEKKLKSANPGELTVRKPKSATVDSCQIQHPEFVATEAGTATDFIYGRVTAKNCTGAKDRCKGLSAEVGYGPLETDPTKKPNAYSWSSAVYNAKHESKDGRDEYQVKLTPSKPGNYAVVYRFSDDGGKSWTYCDRDGSGTGGFSRTGATILKARGAGTPTIDWCNVQHPAMVTVKKGKQTPKIYGQVYSKGCTDGGSGMNCSAISAELGVGAGGNPRYSPSKFTWKSASRNSKFGGSSNDEFEARYTPSMKGTLHYFYRFSGDGGKSWTYCDTDDQTEHSAASPGVLTVQ